MRGFKFIKALRGRLSSPRRDHTKETYGRQDPKLHYYTTTIAGSEIRTYTVEPNK